MATNDNKEENEPGEDGNKNYITWLTKSFARRVNKIEDLNKQDSEKPKELEAVTFHDAVKTTLIAGQLFSLLPVSGVTAKSPLGARFIRYSWRCIYALISLLGQAFMTFMCLNRAFSSVTSLKGTTTVIFYLITSVMMGLFLKMAFRWPKLVRKIAKTEDIDPMYKSNLVKKCNITCGVFLFLALIEHILSLLSAFASSHYCFPNVGAYEGFLRHFYPWMFTLLPYSLGLGVVTQIIHVQSTFLWSYSDLFVIVISLFLTERLNHVNGKLLEAQGKYLPEMFWRSMREEYSRVTEIVRIIDDVIGSIVLMSFANNLFFICFQLFNTLESGLKGSSECARMASDNSDTLLGGYESASYFLFSLIYLILKSGAVSLIAAQVNTASMVPAPVLYDVPSPVFCTEVQRFLDQVNGDNVALTGLQFFSVTRGLLLSVAGTIVTYELVMVQFNAPPAEKTIANITK